MPPEQQPAVDSHQEGVQPGAPVAPQAAPAPFIPQTSPSAGDDTYASPGWSWAGFMQGPFFLLAIRSYSTLWFYLLLLVPIVNMFAGLGIAIYLGVKGREMAAASPTFANRDQYVGYMKAADHAGKIMFFVTIVLIAIAFVFSGIVLSSLGDARERAADAELRQEEALLKAERAYEEYPGDRVE